MEQSIELDCPPGDPRPGDLIGAVVKGTILENLPEAHPDATVSRFYGCWKWDFSKVPADQWEEVRLITKERITALYHNGTIRYGSW